MNERDGRPKRRPAGRAIRLAFVGALLIQLYVLYLHAPTASDPFALGHLDKVVHAVIFLMPAVLGVLALVPVWFVGVVLAAHALISELVQYLWLPARNGDVWDVVADWTGLILGLVAADRLRQWSRRGPTGREGVPRPPAG